MSTQITVKAKTKAWADLPIEETPIDKESLQDFEKRIEESELTYWHKPVATKGALPAEGESSNGETCVVTGETKPYIWESTKKEWVIPTYTATTIESHTWALTEELKLLEGKELPGPFIRLAANEKQKLLKFEAATRIFAAQTCEIEFFYNKAARKFSGGSTKFKIEETAKEFELETAIELANKDSLGIKISSATTNATGLAFTAFVEHVATIT